MSRKAPAVIIARRHFSAGVAALRAVIPAKAGSSFDVDAVRVAWNWIPASAGMTMGRAGRPV